MFILLYLVLYTGLELIKVDHFLAVVLSLLMLLFDMMVITGIYNRLSGNHLGDKSTDCLEGSESDSKRF